MSGLTREKLYGIMALAQQVRRVDFADLRLMSDEIERLWAERDFSKEDMDEAIGAAFARQQFKEMKAVIESTEVRPSLVLDDDALSQSWDMVRCPACRVVIEALHREGKLIRADEVQVLSYVCPHCHRRIHWGPRV